MKIVKGLIGLLSIYAALALMPVAVYADEISSYSYVVVGGEACITEYAGDEENVKIPSSLDGYVVTRIQNRTFFDNSVIKEIKIPNTVKSIDATTFSSCLCLENINVSEQNSAFTSEDGVLLSKDKKKLIACPITKTGEYNIAFGITTIAESAFAGSMMSTINIPSSIVRIEDNAFYNCDNISRIDIPSSVNYIGAGVFGACDELQEIHVDANNCAFTSIVGNLYSKDACELYSVASGVKSTFTVPKNVIRIKEYALAGASFDTVILGSNVEDIEDGAFYYADYLKKVVLNDKLINIGNYAFFMCNELQSIVIGANVREIGNYAFANCANLREVSFLKQNPPCVGDGAFTNNSELVRFYIPSKYINRYKELLGSYNIPFVNGAYGKSDISLCMVASIANYTYTDGSLGNINITVYDGSYKLNKDVDYWVSYKNYSGIGAATAIISGIGAYDGVTYKEFMIEARDIKSVTVSSVSNKSYTGGYIKPSISVKLASKLLKSGKDYELIYISNKDIGKASIRINGIGTYCGSKTIYFNIVPGKISAPSYKSRSELTIYLKWTKYTKASYYQVYKYDSKKKVYVFYKNVTANYLNVTKLSANTKYYFKIRVVTKKNGTCYYSDYSSAAGIYTTIKATSVKLTKKTKSIVVKWSKVSGATGYEVYMSLKKNSGYTKKKVYTKGSYVSYTAKSLKSGRTYYFKVRAYRLVNGVKIYGVYSTVKYIKAK